MRVIAEAKQPIADQTVSITLKPVDGSKLPPFEPGAHIELGFAGMQRRYSLVSDPQDLSHYRICVLRTQPSRGGSAWLHDVLARGDELELQGPFNAFPLREDLDHVVFIAGGIGITPFIPMMQRLDRIGLDWTLHYAARRPQRFVPLNGGHGERHFYSDAGGGARLVVADVIDASPTDAHVYVCGPRSLIEATRSHALESGWAAARIHFESFGAQRQPGDRAVRVHLALSDMTLEVEPGTTLLDALLAHGVWAPYECRRGECASCVTEILSGEVDHRDLCLTAEQRRNHLCTCISWPTSDEITLNL